MIYAGILAGGKGTRMGITDLPKQFLELGKKPIIIHTIEKFMLIPEFKKVVLGIHPDWVIYMEDLVDKYLSIYKDRIVITAGGEDRNSTIENVIRAIEQIAPINDEDIIVTHDAVRPFLTLRIIEDNIRLAQQCDAVDTVVEAIDTIVESLDNTTITSIPERKYYYQGQTPQSFKMKDFLTQYQALSVEQKELLTDACKIFVINGRKVALAKGEYSNIKVTTITDLKIARSMLEE
ncbi:2-C-methyl-D-erythritol 4-phosphate cytidylyltransferase [Bibersteinia trehalosi]|uniref:Ribitol-5-phosphate cytidylyltransferase n=2 Tax=Bibersteinia trehalosi TaxID=47735 RepID=W0R5I7_BIBTR|nr:2-C-methyl-D-erythritol 4-phosphate cytidylyltransferase [Bibersteinia trehalosi]AHG85692.1 2-C-methyl-D-erythritol 4-phosphate cytidylyltransferase 1 [Bibersteinia trehalosi USDA-ARS-USMARC-190]RRN00365.1 2-C-methyl-D-erythritol 4-phosphate cytidylyltransferase [Bibersteinia trehalosi]